MFTIIEEQFDNSIVLTNDMLKNAINSYELDNQYCHEMTESVNDDRIDDLLYTEATGEFSAKVSDTFKKIIEAVKKFIQDTKRAIKAKIMKHNINKQIKALELKMKELTDAGYDVDGCTVTLNPKNKARVNRDVRFVINIYKKYADSIVDLVVKFDNYSESELNNLVKTVERYNDKYESNLENVLSDYMSSVKTTDSLYEEVVSEIDDLNDNLDELEDIMNNKLDDLQEKAAKIAEAEKDEKKAEAKAKKVALLKSVANKITSAGKKTTNAIAKHPFVSLSALFIGLSTLVSTKALKNQKKAIKALGNL